MRSLFRYCTEILHLSEHAAYNRIAAARAVRKFPVILDLLADGSVNLTTVTIIAPHLTPENHRAVLEEATHRTKEEVEVIKARLAPRPDVPATIRKLPAPAEIASRPVPDGQRPCLKTPRVEQRTPGTRRQLFATACSATTGGRAPRAGALSAAVHGG